MNTTTASLAALILSLAAAASAHAKGPMPMPNGYTGPGVTNCYDYVSACGNNRAPTGNYYGPDNLARDARVRSQNYYGNPMDANGHYHPGDYLVTKDGHSGYVNSRGRIDHYHQYSDGGRFRSGQRYPDYRNLHPWRDGQGGLRTNDDLRGFIHSGDSFRPYRKTPPGGITVYHRH
jgi:hypothetical protein